MYVCFLFSETTVERFDLKWVSVCVCWDEMRWVWLLAYKNILRGERKDWLWLYDFSKWWNNFFILQWWWYVGGVGWGWGLGSFNTEGWGRGRIIQNVPWSASVWKKNFDFFMIFNFWIFKILILNWRQCTYISHYNEGTVPIW